MTTASVAVAIDGIEKVPDILVPAPLAAGVKPSLAGLGRSEISEKLAGIGVLPRELRMRTGQLWHWIYHRGATSFDEMLNVSKDMRAVLGEHFTLERPAIVSEQISVDGTRKWLIRMPPAGPHDKGAEIETVYIPESDRGTLCISSQVGCTLTCTFCHTGTQRLVRNLTAAEIVAQVLIARDRLGDWPGPCCLWLACVSVVYSRYQGRRQRAAKAIAQAPKPGSLDASA